MLSFFLINFLKGNDGFGLCDSWLRCFQFFFSFLGSKENFLLLMWDLFLVLFRILWLSRLLILGILS